MSEHERVEEALRWADGLLAHKYMDDAHSALICLAAEVRRLRAVIKLRADRDRDALDDARGEVVMNDAGD